MPEYKISIIIPTYNIETDIHRAFNSLLTQSIGFNNLEVILVDDKSTDNTQQIILEFANRYNNVKYCFLKTNSGSAGKPRNVGIELATSEYIMFLDNDDEYVNKACEILYDSINGTDYNLVVCSKINYLHTPKDQPKEITNSPEILEKNVLENPEILYDFTDYPNAMWSKIFNRKFLLKNNIKCLEKLPEDMYFMHQCYYLSPNVLFILNLNLYNHYFYRTTGKSISVTASPRFINKTIYTFTKLEELSKSYPNVDKFFNRYTELFLGITAYNIAVTDATKEQRYCLMKKYSKIAKSHPNIEIKSIFYKLIRSENYKLTFLLSKLLIFLKKMKIIN